MLRQLTAFPRHGLRRLLSRYGVPLSVAVAVACLAALGGSWGTALGQTVPTPPPPPLPGGAQLLGSPSGGTIPPEGGTLGTPNPNMDVTLPGGTGGSTNLTFTPVDPNSLGGSLGSDYQLAGFQFGDGALLIGGLPGLFAVGHPAPSGYFQAAAVQVVPLGQQSGFAVPLVLTYRPPQTDLQRAGGDITRVVPALWTGKGWLGLPSSVDAASNKITTTVARSGLVAIVIRPADVKAVEAPLSNGAFFTAANGFGGAGGTGYSVTDDNDAAFWSGFQRMGGVDRIGYPISGRFMHGGFATQAFQKLALQWRPELQAAVPVNVFDDLNQRGVDGWLDTFRQVPQAADTSEDSGLAWDAVQARHLANLDPYPALLAAYLNDPNWLEDYGLPLSVKQYGPVVGARLQRATLQLWTVDVPWAAAGTVVVGNGGDLAKEAGLWPIDALLPQPQR